MALDLVAGRASLEVRALSRTVLGWRTKRGWSLKELGELVGFSPAKLSQLCRAVVRMSALEVVAVGAACGASDEEVELCVRVAQRAVDPAMWDRINGDAWARLTWTPWDVMAEASELVIVAGEVLPELVRVDSYHAALLESGAAAHELDLALQHEVLKRLEMDAKAAARPGSPRRLRVRLIVTESLIRDTVGGARAMADQLELLEELSELPGFEFRVVDGNAGPYFGQGASFTMMRFVEKRFDDAVLLRTLHGGDTWLESAAEREPYERALLVLDGVLRSGEESARWLSHASLRLQDPLPDNDSGDQQRHLQLVADQAGS
ncbi:Scr1 family TA system antitoxin-like transcriptional regulator [Lentzea sp. BCCO 10_0856]|uniref:Scr1 family TA system antitoxin-like transcriptional regulator n=1 Tax=Lentzea miocenica TaxID=3095431 RepID=A0ABU4TD86_9PSEU|nr:Scr1 family TA system antitoxin-like transcriptional regulator [Lentzea sp. BCCO 10_0856]MDX8035858.1 Scr1 family TA system antitoxin-like transcriptional regulator [Lentzea sp. BCCO 10_0856]